MKARFAVEFDEPLLASGVYREAKQSPPSRGPWEEIAAGPSNPSKGFRPHCPRRGTGGKEKQSRSEKSQVKQ